MADVRPEISIVVPVYGAPECIEPLYQRLTQVLEELVEAHELVFVEDGAGDGSWDLLKGLAIADPRLRPFRLSRNFGQEAATTAGLQNATGRWVVVMDCDLQDPPEELPKLYRRALEGYDLVRARRRNSDKGASVARTSASRLYFGALNLVNGAELNNEYGAFCIMSKRVRDAYLSIRDRDRNFLLITHWLGFEVADVEVRHDERPFGRSSYTFVALVRYAVRGAFFQTTAPLRWVIYLGFLLSIVGVAAAGALVVWRLNHGAYPGWASLMVLQLLIAGFMIVSTGITGLYVGRVFEQVKGRPLYIVDRTPEDIHG